MQISEKNRNSNAVNISRHQVAIYRQDTVFKRHSYGIPRYRFIVERKRISSRTVGSYGFGLASLACELPADAESSQRRSDIFHLWLLGVQCRLYS